MSAPHFRCILNFREMKIVSKDFFLLRFAGFFVNM